MVLGYGDLKRGVTIELDGEPFQVEEYSHSKMQQRAPVIKLKLRNIRTGQRVDKSYQGYDVKFNMAAVKSRKTQYIYQDQDEYCFMDLETFEQYIISKEQLKDSVNFLREEAEVEVVFYDDSPITIQLSAHVNLQVAESPPGVKGDSTSGATKPAVLETGLTVQVPLFINPGEMVKIDSRSGEYLERA